MIDESKNPWKILNKEMVFDNPWITLTRHQVINPSGGPGEYTVVGFKNLAIGVVPMDEEFNIWLVGQYRFPLSQYSWEIPEGGGSKDDTPETSAQRELLEETGITASNLTHILDMHLSNSVSDEIGHVYLATGLEFGEAQPEETEELVIRKVPFKQAVAMVHDGTITDSLSVGALLKLETMQLKHQWPFNSKEA